MLKRWSSRHVAARLASVVTLWTVAKALDTPGARRATEKLDQKLQGASTKTQRKLHRARYNAENHTGYVAAGVASLIGAVLLFGRAFRR